MTSLVAADQQIERLHRQVSRRVNYLWRLIHRMTDVGFRQWTRRVIFAVSVT